MPLGDPLHNRQSRAGPLDLASDRPLEQLENPLSKLWRYPRAPVGDRQPRRLAELTAPNLDLRWLSRTGVLQGVPHQVVQRPRGPATVSLQQRQGVRHLHAGIRLAQLRLQLPQYVGDQFFRRNIGLGLRRPLHSRERQHLLQQPIQTLGPPPDPRQKIPSLLFQSVAILVAHQLREILDRPQRLPQVVRRHVEQRLEVGVLRPNLGFRLLHRGDVPQHHHPPGRVPVGVPQRPAIHTDRPPFGMLGVPHHQRLISHRLAPNRPRQGEVRRRVRGLRVGQKQPKQPRPFANGSLPRCRAQQALGCRVPHHQPPRQITHHHPIRKTLQNRLQQFGLLLQSQLRLLQFAMAGFQLGTRVRQRLFGLLPGGHIRRQDLHPHDRPLRVVNGRFDYPDPPLLAPGVDIAVDRLQRAASRQHLFVPGTVALRKILGKQLEVCPPQQPLQRHARVIKVPPIHEGVSQSRIFAQHRQRQVLNQGVVQRLRVPQRLLGFQLDRRLLPPDLHQLLGLADGLGLQQRLGLLQAAPRLDQRQHRQDRSPDRHHHHGTNPGNRQPPVGLERQQPRLRRRRQQRGHRRQQRHHHRHAQRPAQIAGPGRNPDRPQIQHRLGRARNRNQHIDCEHQQRQHHAERKRERCLGHGRHPLEFAPPYREPPRNATFRARDHVGTSPRLP